MSKADKSVIFESLGRFSAASEDRDDCDDGGDTVEIDGLGDREGKYSSAALCIK